MYEMLRAPFEPPAPACPPASLSDRDQKLWAQKAAEEHPVLKTGPLLRPVDVSMDRAAHYSYNNRFFFILFFLLHLHLLVRLRLRVISFNARERGEEEEEEKKQQKKMWTSRRHCMLLLLLN
uniref:Uncharacterized protein n=1 Tax=Globodera rostochiensis TaxID=31243 RepID=A0A914H6V1_GLORO